MLTAYNRRPVNQSLSFGPASPEPSRSPRGRVLIVDDERDTVDTLAALLAQEGYATRGVYRGRDVSSAIGDFEPDAVLIDLGMPDMSGWEVARMIREKHGDKVLLIAISGLYKQSADRILTNMVGFNYFVTKPYDLNVVLALLTPASKP
jgi:DNA-binding response OmpR family regulator